MQTQHDSILSAIKNAVLSVDSSAEMILFGSRARGDFNEDSDWDVLVLTTQMVNGTLKGKITEELFPIGLENSAVISPVIVNKQNWVSKFKGYPLYNAIKREGVRI